MMDLLEKEPVGKLMMKYAVPCIILLLVAAFGSFPSPSSRVQQKQQARFRWLATRQR